MMVRPTKTPSPISISTRRSATNSSNCIYWNKLGVRRALTELKIPGGGTIPAGQGYLPNAGIGWKQSNGFYYPPAFHSQNLFFNGVDIRHYVVSPITFPGVYRTDAVKAEDRSSPTTRGTTRSSTPVSATSTGRPS